jgi:hypothetical protein
MSFAQALLRGPKGIPTHQSDTHPLADETSPYHSSHHRVRAHFVLTLAKAFGGLRMETGSEKQAKE